VGGGEWECSHEIGVVLLYNTLSSLFDRSNGGDGDVRTDVHVDVTDELDADVDVDVNDVVAGDCWSYISMSESTCVVMLEQVR